MTLHAPLWEQNDSYPAALDRTLIDVLFATGGGVVLSTDLAVTQRGAGANMSVDVSAGKIVIPGTDISDQGKYLCWSDAVTNVVIATAPGTGLSRIDLVVAKVRDADAIGGSNNDWVIQAVTGTAATTGTQVAPAAPASSVTLAAVAVGPNVTSIVTGNLSDTRPTTRVSVRNNPQGTIYLSSGQTIGAAAQCSPMAVSSLRGGMTSPSNNLVVPVAGIYRVACQIQYISGGTSTAIGAMVYKNGSASGILSQQWASGGLVEISPGMSAEILLASGDILTLWGSSATNSSTAAVGLSTSLSASLVSV